MSSEAEFLSLFLPLQRELRAYVSAAIRDNHAQNDIIQQTALILWRTFDQYDRTRPFATWARGIARNVILQHYRKAGRNPILIEPEALEALLNAFAETQPDDPGLYPEALQLCLAQAPAKSRQLLELRYQLSLSIADIAGRLNSTGNAVNQALIRIRTALQDCIERRMRALRQTGAVPS
jgi:RNA polymerase sigma-70 factor (ECF subfamily)